MTKVYVNLDPNQPTSEYENTPYVGMHVVEIATGRKANITGVYPRDDEIWMVSGNDIGAVKLSHFWEQFKVVK